MAPASATASPAAALPSRRQPQVEPAEQRYQGRLANGSPLLNLLGAAAQATGRPALSGNELGAKISAQVVAEIATEAAGSGLRPALEAAAQVRSFDQDLFGALIREPGEPAGPGLAARQFEELCRLSFVQPAGRGAALHDSVRAAKQS